MSLSRKSIVIICLSVLAALIVISAAAISLLRSSFSAEAVLGTWKGGQIYLDVKNPDAIIISERLSVLPKDMLTIPLLKDTLTESFVFYYEDHPGKTLLTGTLKRLAYEKDLTFDEKLIQSVFDTPSEVFLWRGPNGQLDYWALSMEHHALAKALEGVGKMAFSDVQLATVGEVKVDGQNVSLYGLRLSSKRAFLFASHKDRLLVLSHPEILLKEKEVQEKKEGQKDKGDEQENNGGEENAWKDRLPAFHGMAIIQDRAEVLSSLLSSRASVRTEWQKNLLISEVSPSHTGHDIYVSANYLSFGYQLFFPAIEGLHFRFDTASWQSQVLVDPAKLSAKPGKLKSLWQSVPVSPAACSALPLDWSNVQQYTEKMSSEKLGPQKMTQDAAVCWYGKSSLAAPLFVARFEDAHSAQAQAGALSAVFTRIIGGREPRNNNQRFPVETEKTGDDIIRITRVVSAKYGSHESKELKEADKMASDRYFPVTLAVAGSNIFFSPDKTLVDDAIAVYQNRLPALADTLQEPEKTRVTITPKTLSQLIEKEAWQTLPTYSSSVLRKVAKAHLQPRLKVLAGYGPVELRVQDVQGERQWVPLEIVFAKKPGK